MASNAQKIDSSSALTHKGADQSRRGREICGFYGAKAAATAIKTAKKVLARTDDDANGSYRDMFDQQVMKADMRAVSTEYAWHMNSCDPCAADPLSHEELLSLGVFWLTKTPPDLVPGHGSRPIVPAMGGGRDVSVRRMDARYDTRHSAELTGRKLDDIRQQMNLRTADASNDGKWRQKLRTS